MRERGQHAAASRRADAMTVVGRMLEAMASA